MNLSRWFYLLGKERWLIHHSFQLISNPLFFPMENELDLLEQIEQKESEYNQTKQTPVEGRDQYMKEKESVLLTVNEDGAKR